MSDSVVPRSMRAAVWRGGLDVSVETLPVPACGDGDLVVAVEACGLCPTDIKKIDHALATPPIVLGHEMVGRVAAAGAGAERFLGRRVGLYHHVPCRQCPHCKRRLYSQCAGYKRTGTTAGFAPAGGGWAEYVRVMPWIVAGGGVVELPEDLPAHVAILMEPLNTCLRCVRGLPESPGTCAVFGLGPVGLMLVALARREGWDVIGVEPVPERAELARAFGARQVLRPDAGLVEGLRAAAPPFGPDAALAATDADAAVDAALRSVRPGGAVMLFGHTRLGQPLTVDGGQIGVAEKRLLGSYSSSVDLNDAVREILLDAAMPWARLVTHLMPLGDINRALGLARHPEAGSLKIAVTALAAPKGGA